MRINILVFALLIVSCAIQEKQERKGSPTKKAGVQKKQVVDEEHVVLLDHKYFKIAYNPQRRLAQYVTYELTAEQLKHKKAQRANKFIPDPLLVQQGLPYVVTAEYARSGYDRGHLAPSADFAWSQEANDLTFVMSNMAPQSPALNRDAWKRLEDQTRKWACGEKKITVITGPIFKEKLSTLKSGLEIPQDFFKIIVDETPPKKMVSFVYHQNDKGDVLVKNRVPIKKIEMSTRIAFNKDFPELASEGIRSPASLNEWKEAECGGL